MGGFAMRRGHSLKSGRRSRSSSTLGANEDQGAEQVRAHCGDDDFRREFVATLDVHDRHDSEHDVEQGDKKTDRRRYGDGFGDGRD